MLIDWVLEPINGRGIKVLSGQAGQLLVLGMRSVLLEAHSSVREDGNLNKSWGAAGKEGMGAG